MTNAVSVVIPFDLRQRAKDYRINISEVARKALSEEVAKRDKEQEMIARAREAGKVKQ